MTEYNDRIFQQELDIETAIASAQEISRELSLDRLLARLLEILRQATLATRICLLEKSGDRWQLLANYDAGVNEVKILPSAPLEIPTVIVDYVAQIESSLILNDAVNRDSTDDLGVREQQLKSILCMPLLGSNSNGGILYLEHEIAGAFTAQLQQNLQIITAQAAIAIANARKHQQVALELSDREAALEVSKAELSGILDIAKDAIISVDSSQNICRFNQGAEKIFGYKVDEVLGKSLDLLLPVQAVRSHHQHIKDFGSNSVAPSRMMGERRSVYGRRRDGTEFPTEASVSKFQYFILFFLSEIQIIHNPKLRSLFHSDEKAVANV